MSRAYSAPIPAPPTPSLAELGGALPMHTLKNFSMPLIKIISSYLCHDWVARCRPDWEEIQQAAIALWPEGRISLTPEEFVEILSNLPSEFVKEFGSDYQEGMTKEHLKKLFKLVIPEKDDARMPQDSFTRAVAALYRPIPSKFKLTESIFSRYRYSFREYEASYVYKDATRAAQAIDCLFKALFETSNPPPYIGDKTRAQAEEFRQKTNTNFVIRFSNSTLDGTLTWGVNAELCLKFPVNWFYGIADKQKYAFLLVMVGRPMFCGHQFRDERFKPSDNLQWVDRQVTEVFVPQFKEREEYLTKTIPSEWKKFVGPKSIKLPEDLYALLEFDILKPLFDKVPLREFFKLSLDYPLVIYAMQHFNVRDAFNRYQFPLDELKKLTLTDIEWLKNINSVYVQKVFRLSLDHPLVIQALHHFNNFRDALIDISFHWMS